MVDNRLELALDLLAASRGSLGLGRQLERCRLRLGFDHQSGLLFDRGLNVCARIASLQCRDVHSLGLGSLQELILGHVFDHFRCLVAVLSGAGLLADHPVRKSVSIPLAVGAGTLVVLCLTLDHLAVDQSSEGRCGVVCLQVSELTLGFCRFFGLLLRRQYLGRIDGRFLRLIG